MKKKQKLNKPVNLSQNNREQKKPMSSAEVANHLNREVSGNINPNINITPPGGLNHTVCYNHYYDGWSGCHGWTCNSNGTNYAVTLCNHGTEFSYWEV
jgi:hypothetical protein